MGTVPEIVSVQVTISPIVAVPPPSGPVHVLSASIDVWATVPSVGGAPRVASRRRKSPRAATRRRGGRGVRVMPAFRVRDGRPGVAGWRLCPRSDVTGYTRSRVANAITGERSRPGGHIAGYARP